MSNYPSPLPNVITVPIGFLRKPCQRSIPTEGACVVFENNDPPSLLFHSNRSPECTSDLAGEALLRSTWLDVKLVYYAVAIRVLNSTFLGLHKIVPPRTPQLSHQDLWLQVLVPCTTIWANPTFSPYPKICARHLSSRSSSHESIHYSRSCMCVRRDYRRNIHIYIMQKKKKTAAKKKQSRLLVAFFFRILMESVRMYAVQIPFFLP